MSSMERALARFSLGLLPADQPAAWPSRLRTGMASLVAIAEGDPRAGLDLLAALFPDGSTSAGLSEQDLWARLLLQSGDAQAALDCARARQEQRDSWIPRVLILDATIAAGDLAAARGTLAELLQTLEPASVVGFNATGTLALAEDDLAGAEAAFREALAIRPDNVPAMRGLARCLAAGSSMEDATGLLRDAANLAGAEERLRLLQEIVVFQEQHDPAVAAARQALDEALERFAEYLREQLQESRARVLSGKVPRAARPRAETARRPEQSLPESGLLRRETVNPDEVPPDELRRALFEHFGHTEFRAGQGQVLRSVLGEGKDTLALMPTGAGKSLCFQLPALLLPGVVVVISPLVALMADQLAGLQDVPALADRATYINGTLSQDEIERRLARLGEGAYSLVYLAPERLRLAATQRALRRAGVSLLVIDEAHCLCLWGHDFRTEYLAVGGLARALDVPRVLAVTATATPAMQEEIAVSLGRPLHVVSTGVLRENLYLEVRQLANDAEKRSTLLTFLRGQRGSCIVYAGSRERCESLARDLRRGGVQAAYYHARMGSEERQQAQDAFMSGRIRVLVATVAFGMGINKRDVRSIVHYNPARSLEAYTQEAGRAGRDGHPAHCLVLVTSADKGTLTRRGGEAALQKEELRALYARLRGAVRAAAGGPILPQALGGWDDGGDTAMRVGLSALERAGFVRRGRDAPQEMTLQLLRMPDEPRLQAIVAALGLPVGGSRTVSTAVLAGALAVGLDEAEDLLLDGQDAGLISVRPGRRGMVLTLIDPPPPAAAASLDSLLALYAESAAARAQAMVGYMETSHCRNAYIARHFGEAGAGNCGRCDVCNPGERRSDAPAKRVVHAVTSMEPQAAILQLVSELPFNAGRTGLAKILRGSDSSTVGPERTPLHGVLGGMSLAKIINEIDQLLADGLLEPLVKGEYTLVRIGTRGRTRLADMVG